MRRLHHLLVSFLEDRRGAAVIETALVLPFLLILVLGGTEITRFVVLNSKLDRAAMTVSDLVAQEEAITFAEMNGIFDAVTPILSPFPLGANGRLIVTSISNNSGNVVVNWQQTYGGGSSASQVSAGGLPLALNSGETVIVGEAFYQFTPFFVPNDFTATITNRQLYKVAYYRARTGNLQQITTN